MSSCVMIPHRHQVRPLFFLTRLSLYLTFTVLLGSVTLLHGVGESGNRSTPDWSQDVFKTCVTSRRSHVCCFKSAMAFAIDLARRPTLNATGNRVCCRALTPNTGSCDHFLSQLCAHTLWLTTISGNEAVFPLNSTVQPSTVQPTFTHVSGREGCQQGYGACEQHSASSINQEQGCNTGRIPSCTHFQIKVFLAVQPAWCHICLV